MAIDNRKERIAEKLINEEELTREEIIFLLENFKEVSRVDIPEFDRLRFIVASVLEVGKDLYYEVIWYFSPFVRVQKEYRTQPRRVKNTQKKRDVYIPYDD
ncbi:MAG: hypothetical protein [Caudoviricetes sp.]|nr:MAG: hypothetical protein [Caudoviricetes sp.]